MAPSQRPNDITYYEELGVHAAASADEIRKAFRTLAVLLHPDQQSDAHLKDMAERQMRKLNRVYSVLSDPVRRTAYDLSLTSSSTPTVVSRNSGLTLKKMLVGSGIAAGIVFGVFLLVWYAVTIYKSPALPRQQARGGATAKSGSDAGVQGGSVNQNMWQLFVDGLQQTGILAVDPATFKAASGLAIADWEIMDYTGIQPKEGRGTPVPSKVFLWADPMPDINGRFYEPGASLSDSYASFLNSLSVSAEDSATIAQARSRAFQFQMSDGTGNNWPGYSITPGLNDFLLASLQSITLAKSPQIDFWLTLPALTGDSGVSSRAPLALRRSPADAGTTLSRWTSADLPFFGINGQPMTSVPRSIAETRRLVMYAAASTSTTAGSGTVPKIRFQAQTAQMFTIRPSMWYSEGTVSMFYDRIDPRSALANKPVFGPGGFLSGRALQILVAFKRVVTVSGPASLIEDIRDDVHQTRDAFNIASFHFAAAPRTAVKQPDPGTIIFEDNTNAPAVIGITVKVLGRQ